jgi:hypothetical protein
LHDPEGYNVERERVEINMVTIADLKSGVQRRAPVSVWAMMLGVIALMMVPLLIAFDVAWKAKRDLQGLYARHRVLEIETANQRAAIAALIGQIRSQETAVADDGATSAAASGSAERGSATGTPVVRSSSATVPRPVPAPALNSSPVAPVPPATITGQAVVGIEAAARGAVIGAPAALPETRHSPDADATSVTSVTYRAGVALELEALERSTAERVNDAVVRTVETDLRFRAAEIEAPAQSARELVTLADPSASFVRASLADVRQLPAAPFHLLRSGLPEPVPPPAVPAVDGEQIIRDVIAQYVSGLESRNLAALKRVWPSLSGSQQRAIQTEFQNARTVQTLFTDPRITIHGDTTTVTGFRTYTLVTQDDQRLMSVTRTTMTLRRSGDAWFIERVVHHQ